MKKIINACEQLLKDFGAKDAEKMTVDDMVIHCEDILSVDKLGKLNGPEKGLQMKLLAKIRMSKSKIKLLTVITEIMFELSGMSADI